MSNSRSHVRGAFDGSSAEAALAEPGTEHTITVAELPADAAGATQFTLT